MTDADLDLWEALLALHGGEDGLASNATESTGLQTEMLHSERKHASSKGLELPPQSILACVEALDPYQNVMPALLLLSLAQRRAFTGRNKKQ